MRLRILLPDRIFLEAQGVTRIVAQSASGSLGLLPRRLDCAVSLVPGILDYTGADGRDVYVAIDEGILTKTGEEVTVVVRDAVGGADPGSIGKALQEELRSRESDVGAFREALARFEGDFVRRFLEAERHG